MNSPYTPSSRTTRTFLAVVACVATLLVLGSIHGLAEHYGPVQLAAAPAVVAQA